MKYYVVDAETSIKNTGEGAIGDMKASPFHHDNKIVRFGEMNKGDANTFAPWTTPELVQIPECLQYAREEPVLLVGANLGFDLKYMMGTWPDTYADVINNIHIWDVQQVAYLLSGQTWMYPSLNDMAVEAGGTLKDDKIKEYWDAGVDTELIPVGELDEYLKGDLTNTDTVFKYQYEIVRRIPALWELVRVKMDDLLATTMMEWNGMRFDLKYAMTQADLNDKVIAALRTDLNDMAGHHFQPGFEFNPESNEHVSLLLFGGCYKMREAVKVQDKDGNYILYKTGNRKGEFKTRLEDVSYNLHGIIGTPSWLEPNAKGIYPVGEEVLKKLGIHTANMILELRELVKENSTYYRGYAALTWPDGLIHGSVGHCGTRTGRNNHSKPNLGNVTREE